MGATRTMEGATLLVRLATLHFISVWKISTPAHQDHLGSELTLAEAGLGMLGLPLLLHAPPHTHTISLDLTTLERQVLESHNSSGGK